MIKPKAMSAAHQVSKNISTTETTAPNKPVQGLKYRHDGLHPEIEQKKCSGNYHYMFIICVNIIYYL